MLTGSSKSLNEVADHHQVKSIALFLIISYSLFLWLICYSRVFEHLIKENSYTLRLNKFIIESNVKNSTNSANSINSTNIIQNDKKW